RARAGFAGARVPGRTRLRDAGRHQDARARRVSPPHPAHLRGRGGGRSRRRSDPPDSRPRRSSVITPELLAQVRRLTIRSRRSVEEVFSGAYRSAFRGQGLEFAEVREYVPGDDIRAIDWNVTARAGKPFVKRFVEERELTVVVALDLSGSLAFGS